MVRHQAISQHFTVWCNILPELLKKIQLIFPIEENLPSVIPLVIEMIQFVFNQGHRFYNSEMSNYFIDLTV